jgi:anti-anti-sigma factor
MEALATEGRAILVCELEGPIFFGTADDLARRVEAALRDGATHVILDFRRVNDIDSTGARILLQIDARLRQAGAQLRVSHALDEGAVASALRAAGVTAALGPAAFFADTDAALEAAEDRILARRPDIDVQGEAALERLPVLAGLTEPQYAVLRRLLVRRVFKAGEVVIREGDRDRSLFMTASGTASVRVNLAREGRSKRLATFSGGTVFGEVALLDKEPRSATVTADTELVCYVLSEEGFESLKAAHPAIAIHLLVNLGLELSRRLRKATLMVSQLES